MPAWSVDGMDVLAVEDAAHRAVAEIRGGGGPVFLELRTYRFRAHSMYDPERYRSKDEVDEWRKRDPIELFKARLRRNRRCFTTSDVESIESDVAAEIDAAVAFAEAGTLEPSRTSPGSSTASRHVMKCTYREAMRAGAARRARAR